MLNALKDVLGVLLLAFLLPVWMAVGLGVVAVVVARQLYWWGRGNTTVVSRLAASVRSPSRHRPAPDRDPTAATLDSLLDAPAAGTLNPAIPGVAER